MRLGSSHCDWGAVSATGERGRGKHDFAVAFFLAVGWHLGDVCRQVVVYPTCLWLLAAVLRVALSGLPGRSGREYLLLFEFRERACDGVSDHRERRCYGTRDYRERDHHL